MPGEAGRQAAGSKRVVSEPDGSTLMVSQSVSQRRIVVEEGEERGQAMSDKRGQHQQQDREREQAPYLYVVGRQGGEATVPKPDEDAASAAVVDGARKAEAFSQALMYACVSWVALVREETVQSVDLTPIGQLSYEADVLLADSGERVLLRVGLRVEPGLVVRTVVEPARPS